MESLIGQIIHWILAWIASDPQHAIPAIVAILLFWIASMAGKARPRIALEELPFTDSNSGISPMPAQVEEAYRPLGPAAGPPTSVFKTDSEAQTASSTAIERDRRRQEKSDIAAAATSIAAQAALTAAMPTSHDTRLASRASFRARLLKGVILAQALERPGGLYRQRRSSNRQSH